LPALQAPKPTTLSGSLTSFVDLIRADRHPGKSSVVKIGLSKFINYHSTHFASHIFNLSSQKCLATKKAKNVLNSVFYLAKVKIERRISGGIGIKVIW